jgi:hypothetical protein
MDGDLRSRPIRVIGINEDGLVHLFLEPQRCHLQPHRCFLTRAQDQAGPVGGDADARRAYLPDLQHLIASIADSDLDRARRGPRVYLSKVEIGVAQDQARPAGFCRGFVLRQSDRHDGRTRTNCDCEVARPRPTVDLHCSQGPLSGGDPY